MEDVTERTRQIRRRDLSSQELVGHYLHRIEQHEQKLQAHITVCATEVQSAAAHADELWHRGMWTGVLHGIPVGLKDLIDTAGVRTTAGSEAFATRVPTEDAQVWQQLQRAGALLLGKHNMHEFAYGTTNENAYFGTVHNPWDLHRTAGGSSGGSAAAVAADLSPFSIGTDTGGSIRIPAACTGIYGLKPTYGLVSTRGVTPLAYSLDHVGPLARSVRDIALLMDVIAGYDPFDPCSVRTGQDAEARYGQKIGQPVTGLRIGYEEHFFCQGVDQVILIALQDALHALAQAGAQVTKVSIPFMEHVPKWQNEIISSEAFAFHQTRLDDDSTPFGQATRRRLESGRSLTGAQYAAANWGRRQFVRALDEVFREIDVLITPTLRFVAPDLRMDTTRVNGEDVAYKGCMTQFTNPFNLAGYPAFAVPFGLSPEGLPISLQLVAAPFAERCLLQVGAELEGLRPYVAPPGFAE
ncbi:MAG: amidase [Firmicutes bacterium]|nr:amidase [Bacillota bacterium]